MGIPFLKEGKQYINSEDIRRMNPPKNLNSKTKEDIQDYKISITYKNKEKKVNSTMSERPQKNYTENILSSLSKTLVASKEMLPLLILSTMKPQNLKYDNKRVSSMVENKTSTE